MIFLGKNRIYSNLSIFYTATQLLLSLRSKNLLLRNTTVTEHFIVTIKFTINFIQVQQQQLILDKQ